MKINTGKIITSWGVVQDIPNFLKDHKNQIKSIAHSGEVNGKKISIMDYVSSLSTNDIEYQIKCEKIAGPFNPESIWAVVQVMK